MADDREWVRVEVLWDGGPAPDERDDDDAWAWEEGTGVLPPDFSALFAREDTGTGLSKRRRKRLRGERDGGR